MERTILSLLMLIVLMAASISAQEKPSKNNRLTVKNYTVSGIGSVNSYLITSEEGVIVIDTQRVLSEGQNLLREVKATGKPLVGIILTHGHPDHIGGLASLVREYPNVPIYASPETSQNITTDANGYQKLSRESYGDNVADKIPPPNKIIRSGESFTLGGVSFQAEELGTGESDSMTVLYIPGEKFLFAGDLVANRMSPFLVEGHSSAWLKQIDYVSKKYTGAKTLYPGHGASGEPKKLLSDQKEYLLKFRQLTVEKLKDKTISDQEKKEIIAALEKRYPNYLPVAELPNMVGLSVDGIAKELLSENKEK